MLAAFAAGATLALGETKAAVNAASVDVEAALAREEAGQIALMHTADYREGVAAFLAKRPADFTGALTGTATPSLLSPAGGERRGVKVASRRCQGGVTAPAGCRRRVCRGGMWEDLIAAAVGLALVAYLLYALVRPDRF